MESIKSSICSFNKEDSCDKGVVLKKKFDSLSSNDSSRHCNNKTFKNNNDWTKLE